MRSMFMGRLKERSEDLEVSLPPAVRFGGHAIAALAALALLGWPQLKIEISQTHTIELWTWCGIALIQLRIAALMAFSRKHGKT